MEKKNVILLLVIGVATLVTAVVGTSLAYFTATVSGTGKATTVTAASGLTVTYTDGSQILASNVIPGWTGTKTITVKNNAPTAITYGVSWASVTNTYVDSTASTTTGTHPLVSEFYYNYKKNSGTVSANTALPTAAGAIISGQSLASGATDTYVFNFAFVNLGTNQNANQTKSFSGTFQIAVSNIHS
jgi:hypothetical protein